MKVRLGVTLPLQVALDGKSARFPAPALVSRNFSVSSNLIGLPAVETVSLETPPAAVAVAKVQGDSVQPPTEAIVQTSSVGKPWRPSRVAFVIDTSLAMADSMEATLAALAQAPAGLTKEFYFTRDESPAKPETALPQAVTCCGGRPSLGTLIQAIDSLAAAGGPAALVWIHAGEPVVQQAGDALALKLRKNPQLRLYLCQVASGDCPLVESMSPSVGVVSLTADALLGGVGPALKRLFADWSAESWLSERRKVPVAEVPAAAAPASDHLGRLWAAEETARVFRTGDPVALEKAQKTALPWHIVTAATGAVVLETKDLRKREGENQPRTEHSHARARRINPNRNAVERKPHPFHGNLPSRRAQQPRREMRRDDAQRKTKEKINDHRRGKTKERERDKRKRHRSSSFLLRKKQRHAGQNGENAACRRRQDTAEAVIGQKECCGRPPFPGRE